MRLLLFDWSLGGHHARYLRYFALAAAPFAKVTIAAPDSVLAELSDLQVDHLPLGHGRPAVQVREAQGPQNARLAAEELALMESAIETIKPDHLVNLYGDPIVRWLVQRKRPFASPVSLCIFFVRDHYSKRFGTHFTAREQLRAQFLRWNLRRFRSRSDAHTLFFLDKEAVDVYGDRPGAPVRWFPEPPIAKLATKASPRSRLTIYGALAPRKGVEWVSQAICDHAPSTALTLAGYVDPQFTLELGKCVDRMRSAGADVDLRLHRHDEQSGLRLLAESVGTILAYPAHYGMSRVLVESCSVGTPVIAQDFGLLGHLVRKHGLGVTVDCSNARLLGDTFKKLEAEDDWTERLSGNLKKFSSIYTTSVFRDAVAGAFLEGKHATRPLVASTC